jgi:hypothetical protein
MSGSDSEHSPQGHEDPHRMYRPFVLKSVGVFFAKQTPVSIKVALLAAGLTTLLLPASLRERVLFRERNEWTRKMAEEMLDHIHVDAR